MQDMLSPSQSETLIYFLAAVAWLFLFLSLYVAIRVVFKTSKDLKTNKSSLNYAAIILGVLVIAAIFYEVVSRTIN